MTSGSQRYSQFWKVNATGGMPERLPVPYGEFGALSPDARQIAYMPMTQDFRTWKRYRGGWSPDIWLFDLTTFAAENLTQNDANDAQPMWYGRKLYLLSDRDPLQRNNIWVYDLDSRQTREVTHLTDYDITFPAIGPSDIVFQAGGRLYLLDLTNEQTHEVQVNVVTDLSTLHPHVVRAESVIVNTAISPLGQRAMFEARGELFSLPARYGPVMNLTQTSGVRRAVSGLRAERPAGRVLERPVGRVRAMAAPRRRHRHRAQGDELRCGLPLSPLLVTRQPESRLHRPGAADSRARRRERADGGRGPGTPLVRGQSRGLHAELVGRQPLARVLARHHRGCGAGDLPLRQPQRPRDPGHQRLLQRRPAAVRSRR